VSPRDDDRSKDGHPEIIKITGVVKWFDHAKGYGMITLKNEMRPDILLMADCLRRAGFKTAAEGARIVCEAERIARGWRAVRILSLDVPQ
jgi:cold shock protein